MPIIIARIGIVPVRYRRWSVRSGMHGGIICCNILGVVAGKNIYYPVQITRGEAEYRASMTGFILGNYTLFNLPAEGL